MRLGNRITPAVTRWRGTLTDAGVANAMPRPDMALPAVVPYMKRILDEARASGRINAPEARTLHAIVDNPERDLAELAVLVTVLCELRGHPTPGERRILT
jgi:hypothetical protein